MRGLIILTLLAGFAWSGWWFIGSSAQEAAINGWMEQQRQAGWTAESDTVSVAGFPNRFDTVLTNLELSDPQAGWKWQAPNFQILSLSYKPNHIIAVWPGTHIITTPNDRTSISGDRIRGSVIFAPETSLALARLQLEIENLLMLGDSGWQATVQEANVAFFADNTPAVEDNTYNLFVHAKEITPPTNWRNTLIQKNPLPESIPETVLDATMTFDHQWDRFAIEQGVTRLTMLQIRSLRFIWGALELRGAGKIEVNKDGFAEGEFTVQARNWRDLLQLLIATNVLDAKDAQNIESVLGLLAKAAGNPETIEVTLNFRNNNTYVGFLPIGPAPQIYP